MQKVLKYCFPRQSSKTSASFKYYCTSPKCETDWICKDLTNLPTQSVKVFLKEIEQIENKQMETQEEKYSGYTSLIGKDNINPSHYKNKPKETIERIQDNLTPDEFKGYLKGNILKYLDRYELKNGSEDLKKAQWYLNKLTEIENK